MPAFVIKDGKDWRLVSYEADLLSRVSWGKINLGPIYSLDLSLEETRDVEIRAGLSQELTGFTKLAVGDVESKEISIEYAYGAAHLLDIVPNPWIGYEFVSKVFSNLLVRWKGKEKIVANNFVFILEETRKQLEKERDRLAEQVFNKMLEADEMRFMVIARDLNMNRLPRKVTEEKAAIRATRLDGNQFLLSLFENVPADSLNELEREVASFLDEQSRLYFWYRNVPRRGHYVQGWQRSKIYADFVFTTLGEDGSDYRKVFVLETKGVHLKNENTAYKRSVFALCNQYAKKKVWNDLVPTMRDKDICYEVVFQDEWQKRLNELFAEAKGLSSN